LNFFARSMNPTPCLYRTMRLTGNVNVFPPNQPGGGRWDRVLLNVEVVLGGPIFGFMCGKMTGGP
jgi:hypothetical protein